MSDIGELIDPEIKKFVKTDLIKETIQLFQFYQEFPIEIEYKIDD